MPGPGPRAVDVPGLDVAVADAGPAAARAADVERSVVLGVLTKALEAASARGDVRAMRQALAELRAWRKP